MAIFKLNLKKNLAADDSVPEIITLEEHVKADALPFLFPSSPSFSFLY